MLITALPDFLQPHQWQDPVDAQPTLFGFAHQTDQTIFEWLELQPEQRAILAALTVCQLQPFFRSLLNHPRPSSSGGPSDRPEVVIHVDVGGGRGPVLRQVCHEHDPTGSCSGTFRRTWGGVEGGERVGVMPYDFLDPKPVHGISFPPPIENPGPPFQNEFFPGAHTYPFRHVFHNWSDGAAAKKNLTEHGGRHGADLAAGRCRPGSAGRGRRVALCCIPGCEHDSVWGEEMHTEAQRRRSLKHEGLQLRRIEQLDALTPGSDQVIEAGLL